MVKHRNVTPTKEVATKHIDYLLLTTVCALSIFGIIMVFDSSIKLLANKYHFVILQMIWVVIGIIGMLIISTYPYQKLRKLSIPFMALAILSLIAVLFLGQKVNGAVRWINIGPLQFQPSEITKPILIIYLSAWFSKEKPSFTNLEKGLQHIFFHELLPFLSIIILILGLVIIGKDLGTAIILASIALGIYFIQGTGFVSIISFFIAVLTLALSAGLSVIIEPYRFQRLLTFSGQNKNILGQGYQINQILIAIGSGGWFGRGFTQSIQKQRYLVETTAATDSIFAVIAEEFGFIGALVLFFVYIFFFYRCLHVAFHSRDTFAKLIVMGVTIWIVTQTLLNIAVNVNLVPLTGVPLPFISYGGSSTIILLASIGIVLNISRFIHEKETE